MTATTETIDSPRPQGWMPLMRLSDGLPAIKDGALVWRYGQCYRAVVMQELELGEGGMFLRGGQWWLKLDPLKA